jgi:exodeoxyribonuclease V alpha subunit
MTTEVQQIHGTLDRIRFQSDKGFFIGIFKSQDTNVVALGNLLKPKVGFDYDLTGKWVNNAKWGKQFRFQLYSEIKPKSTDGILRYLVNTAKWVGPVVGARLIEAYGSETMDVLREDPEKVATDIRGITLKRAEEIQNIIVGNETIEALIIDLEALIGGAGLRQSLPIEIAKEFGSDAVDILKDDPYILTTFAGVGFLSADRVALSRFKTVRKSVKRQVAGIKHILKENERSGNVWCYIDTLFRNAETLLGCDITEGFEHVLKSSVIKVANLVAIKQMAYDESYIATKIKALLTFDSI